MLRVRFAPSPTGDLHVGNIRIAVLNHLMKIKYNGSLILRIDDTDIERNSPDGEERIYSQLKWLGIEWDEGPDRGGGYGPYRQSERGEIYQEIIEELKRKNLIYPCFCTDEEIAQMHTMQRLKGEPPHYDGRCFNLSEKERNNLLKEKPPVWRFRILGLDEIVVEDLLHGEIHFSPVDLGGDFVVIRSNGRIMYNLATVVDDHYMQITHIIRGEDHLSNTAKQIAIYRALGWNIPQWIHIPMIVSPDGRKLSKREESITVNELKDKRYIPHAIYFYLGTLGWSQIPSEPLFPEELARNFKPEKLGTSLNRWDERTLASWNRKFLKKLKGEMLLELIEEYLPELSEKFLSNFSREKAIEIVELVKEDVESVTDFEKFLRIFYEDEIPMNEKCGEIIEELLPLLDCDIEGDVIENCINLAGEKGISKKKIFKFIRCVLTGLDSGPPLGEIVRLLNSDKIKIRFSKIVEV